MKKNKLKLKYNPTPLAAALYLILILLVFVVFMGRTYTAIRPSWVNPEFFTHISNFAISFFLTTIWGYMSVLGSGNLKAAAILSLLMITANYIYELWIPVINTCDIVDAHYSFVGVVFAFIFVVYVKFKGIKPNPDYKKV